MGLCSFSGTQMVAKIWGFIREEKQNNIEASTNMILSPFLWLLSIGQVRALNFLYHIYCIHSKRPLQIRWVHIWQSWCTYRKLLCIYNLDNWGVRSTRRWEERRNLNIPVLNDSFCTCSWVRFPPCGKLAAEVFPSSTFDSQFNDINHAQKL